MAVLDSEVHALTKTGAGWHPGCWNKPRTRNPSLVKDGFRFVYDGSGHYESVQMWKMTPDVGSPECRSDCPECIGCDHYDTSHVEMVMRLGK